MAGNFRSSAHRPGARPVLLASVLGFILAGCASQQAGVAPPPPQRVNVASLPEGASAAAQGETPLTSAVLAAVNAYRSAHGAGALTDDGGLQRAAAVHSADMSLRNFIGHFNPDGQGPRERVMAVKPDFKSPVGETIAVLKGVGAKAPENIAEEVLKEWVMSPPHRKIIRDKGYTASGVGVATSGDLLYVTEVFAGPM